jgi:hypothetical protein
MVSTYVSGHAAIHIVTILVSLYFSVEKTDRHATMKAYVDIEHKAYFQGRGG